MWCPHMSPLQQFFTVPYVQHHVIFYPHVPQKTKVSRHLAFVAGFAGQSAHCEVRGWSCWVRSGGPTWFWFWLWKRLSLKQCKLFFDCVIGDCDSEQICFDCDFGHSWFKDNVFFDYDLGFSWFWNKPVFDGCWFSNILCSWIVPIWLWPWHWFCNKNFTDCDFVIDSETCVALRFG